MRPVGNHYRRGVDHELAGQIEGGHDIWSEGDQPVAHAAVRNDAVGRGQVGGEAAIRHHFCRHREFRIERAEIMGRGQDGAAQVIGVRRVEDRLQNDGAVFDIHPRTVRLFCIIITAVARQRNFQRPPAALPPPLAESVPSMTPPASAESEIAPAALAAR